MTRRETTAAVSVTDRLLSETEFKEIVRRKMAGGRFDRIIKLTVVSVDRQDVVAIYETPNVPDGNPSQTRTFFEDGSSAVTCRCEMWPTVTPSGEQPDELMATLAELVRRHWGERDSATMLPYLKSAGVPARFTAAARHASDQSAALAVLHTDLDHFKRVNDEVTETGGNEVLREFADRLRQDLGHLGVVVRTGGEEFSAVLHAESVQAIVMPVIAFRRRMAVEAFARIGRPNTCSIGLSVSVGASGFGAAANQDKVLEQARKAELRAKKEGRNRIALSGTIDSSDAPPSITVADLQLAALAGRPQGSAGSSDATSFSLAVREGLCQALGDGTDIPDAIAGTREELSLVIGEGEPEGDHQHELLGRLGALEWASIVIGALFQAARANPNLFDLTTPLALSVDAEGFLDLLQKSGEFPLCERRTG